MRYSALGDPDLPIDFGGPDPKVIAFLSTNDAAAKITHFGHALKQDRACVTGEEVSRRKGHLEICPECLNQVVHSAGDARLAVDVGIEIGDQEHLAVEGHLHCGKAAVPSNTRILSGRSIATLPGTGYSDFAAFSRDDLDDRIHIEGKRILRRKIVRHRLQDGACLSIVCPGR